MKKECSNCNAMFDSELNYCPNCGLYSESTEENTSWECQKCGRVNNIKDNFCGKCGLSHDTNSNLTNEKEQINNNAESSCRILAKITLYIGFIFGFLLIVLGLSKSGNMDDLTATSIAIIGIILILSSLVSYHFFHVLCNISITLKNISKNRCG